MMNFLEDKGTELKTGIVFSAITAFLVVLLGIFAGRNFWNIIVTLFLACLIFFALGFAIVVILKKIVPELFESTPGSRLDTVVGEDDAGNSESLHDDSFEDETLESDMGESLLVDKGTPKKSTVKIGGEDFEADPETAAKAIRTMLKRDE